MIQNNFQQELEVLLLQNNCSRYVNNNNLDNKALENNYIKVLNIIYKESRGSNKRDFPKRLFESICEVYVYNRKQPIYGIHDLNLFIKERTFTKCDYIAYAYYYFRKHVKNNL